MFKAVNVVYTIEEDQYENGCIPDTSRSCPTRPDVTGKTLDALLQAIADIFGVDRSSIMVDEWNTGGITLSRHEFITGGKATEDAIAQWKMGKRKLFLADYMFVVSETNDVDFTKMTKDEIKSLGISI